MPEVHLNLARTFRENAESSSSDEFEEGYWKEFYPRRTGDLQWAAVLENRVSVVLAEAGMGKTIEFQDQVDRLKVDGKYAYFIPLNKITSVETFHLQFTGVAPEFDRWKNSTETGYFFLDAVDESHLKGITSLTQCLAIICQELSTQFGRCNFIVSSRITDWHIPDVRSAIDKYLLAAVNNVPAGAHHVLENGKVRREVNPDRTNVETRVFKLQPLSHNDVIRLAEAHGALPVDVFWNAIQDGDFQHMATRPRDLEWMAKRWAKIKKLGTYSELLEEAVSNRLKEHNECYMDEGDTLSVDEMRRGAECLAAASVFCNRTFISFSDSVVDSEVIAPPDVLPKWNTKTQRRVLGMSLFDEATYGRVKFQHRSYREFLAAHWLNGLLNAGLPIDEALKLFGGKPYGVPVLLNSTRATLCWLVTLNIQIREYVINGFPEMLMYEGDPEVWGKEEITDAFTGYIERLNSGLRPNWWNDLGEIRRVSRKLPPELVLQFLNKFPNTHKVTPRLLSFVRHGSIIECADTVFRIYRNADIHPTIRRIALSTLSIVGQDLHKNEIRTDLLKGELKSNDFIADALNVVPTDLLSIDEMAAIFDQSDAEGEYGGGAIEQAIVEEILPNLSLDNALKLLRALFKSVGNFDEIKKHQPIYEFARRNVWKLYALVPCLTRVVHECRQNDSAVFKQLTEIVIFISKLKDTRYINAGRFEELRIAIKKVPVIEKTIALIVPSARNLKDLTIVDLVFGERLVTFRIENLEEIVALAVSDQYQGRESETWFRVALFLIFNDRVTEAIRDATIDQLCNVSVKLAKQRRKAIDQEKKKLEAQRQYQKSVDEMEKARLAKIDVQNAQSKSALLGALGEIRNATNFEAIKWLVIFSADRTSRSRYSKVSIESVTEIFGSEVSDAFADGLRLYWQNQIPPNVVDVPNTQVPWTALIGLASVNFYLNDSTKLQDLSDAELIKAVRYCVWELDEPEEWYETASKLRPAPLVNALQPWFIQELKDCRDLSEGLRTVDFVLYRNNPAVKIPLLNTAIQLLLRDEIPHDKLQLRLIHEAIELGLVSDVELSQLALQKVKLPAEQLSDDNKLQWLGEWIAIDFVGAWTWVKSHKKILQNSHADVAICLARSVGGKKWWKQFDGTVPKLTALVEVFKLISPYKDILIKDLSDSDQTFQHPINIFRESIARTIVSQPGAAANACLLQLVDSADQNGFDRDWLQGLVIEQSVSTAEKRMHYSPRDLMNFGDYFCRTPITRRDLFEQVRARLEQIRKNIEFGTFSERAMFIPGMLEEHLQLWLGARLNDTPRRNFSTRFAVYREPVVDQRKRTDIEVSSAGFKVCIEIKPVDQTRYSAKSLVDTIEKQLVGQYLRNGQNSCHGVLVLFRLDQKRWRIPKGPKSGSFTDLITFLQTEADRIRGNYSWCEGLIVVGIDCVEGT